MSSSSPAASSSTPQPGGEDANVDGVRAGRPVGLDLREDFGERHFVDDDLGAGRRFELCPRSARRPAITEPGRVRMLTVIPL